MDSFYQMILRVPKQDSAFLYFTLEANEGICFYSTLPYETGVTHRDIEITGSPELYPELQTILTGLKNKISFEIISERTM